MTEGQKNILSSGNHCKYEECIVERRADVEITRNLRQYPDV